MINAYTLSCMLDYCRLIYIYIYIYIIWFLVVKALQQLMMTVHVCILCINF